MPGKIRDKVAELVKTKSPLYFWTIGVATLIGFSLIFATYNATYMHALNTLRDDANASAMLRAAVLQSEIEKHRTSPAILAVDRDLKDALLTSSPERLRDVSIKLEALRKETKSTVIYVLDTRGTALAASNWGFPDSFVGNSYISRDYFTEALKHGVASQFAMGMVSHRPGLFLSHSVVSGNKIIGVVVVKLEFNAVESEWARLPDKAFVTGADNTIVIAGDPTTRFKRPPPPAQDQLAVSLPIESVPGWRMHVYRSTDTVKATALAVGIITLLAELLIVGAALWAWRRNTHIRLREAADLAYRSRLERDVGERTHALRYANDKLSEEIEERQSAQVRLNALQADLVQANKLANLGQITAGVAHEINQPLATIRVLAENARAGLKPAAIDSNLESIIRMSERIGHITGELRAFSRKASGESEPTSVNEAIEGSILLTHSRMKAHEVKFIRPKVNAALQVWAQRVRLEQVLVNLLQNAFEAVSSIPDAKVTLRVEESADSVRLIVSDNGPGLPESVKKALFIPFTTTKPQGLGLGLVIAQDIVRDFGGDLTADLERSVGACFIIKLRKVPK
ncbi:ATP-binding protein [Asticcacaulis endophyticus]|uniref:histidine kinase n=1 Tax=Asticcacaulis endophyticus TaxID=1395890 RepID=A0A918UU00_9CAUL|nr:ATP-binding protein [Asticcacaulis endophyticus]GGZ32856.1 two-component sensor histidine kinase [Asticcacaulis endophyticus]